MKIFESICEKGIAYDNARTYNTSYGRDGGILTARCFMTGGGGELHWDSSKCCKVALNYCCDIC